MTQYSRPVEELIQAGALDELGPGTANQRAAAGLQALELDQLLDGKPIRDRAMADCCLSGLWLYHGFLDRSHEMSQAIDTVEGSYWHAIMHRREGDFSNSKYWLRRVGDHPIYADLAAEAARLAAEHGHPAGSEALESRGAWNPDRWVDLCERNVRGGAGAAFCRQLQQAEWRLLFDYCYHRAG